MPASLIASLCRFRKTSPAQVETEAPDASLQQAAMAVAEMGVGSLPVCEAIAEISEPFRP
jgi:hypothetical protein